MIHGGKISGKLVVCFFTSLAHSSKNLNLVGSHNLSRRVDLNRKLLFQKSGRARSGGAGFIFHFFLFVTP